MPICSSTEGPTLVFQLPETDFRLDWVCLLQSIHLTSVNCLTWTPCNCCQSFAGSDRIWPRWMARWCNTSRWPTECFECLGSERNCPPLSCHFHCASDQAWQHTGTLVVGSIRKRRLQLRPVYRNQDIPDLCSPESMSARSKESYPCPPFVECSIVCCATIDKNILLTWSTNSKKENLTTQGLSLKL